MSEGGHGFLLRSNQDAPWAGWSGSRFLEEGLASVHAAPGRALARLMHLAALFPGGFALIWDHPPAWMQALPLEARQGWWEAISAIPHLGLHLGPEVAPQLPGGAFRAWVHCPDLPEGPMGELWRQGVLGWVPRPGPTWQLPGLGSAAPGEEVAAGWLWGEVCLPLGALSTLGSGEALIAAMSEAQGAAERGLALRLACGAWADPPFSRRAVGWRLAVTGGTEFQRSGGSWPTALGQLRALKALLKERLRTPIHLGASHDFQMAALLGRQALREGLPWRASLPLPPAPGSFTPGLAADPPRCRAPGGPCPPARGLDGHLRPSPRGPAASPRSAARGGRPDPPGPDPPGPGPALAAPGPAAAGPLRSRSPMGPRSGLSLSRGSGQRRPARALRGLRLIP